MFEYKSVFVGRHIEEREKEVDIYLTPEINVYAKWWTKHSSIVMRCIPIIERTTLSSIVARDTGSALDLLVNAVIFNTCLLFETGVCAFSRSSSDLIFRTLVELLDIRPGHTWVDEEEIDVKMNIPSYTNKVRVIVLASLCAINKAKYGKYVIPDYVDCRMRHAFDAYLLANTPSTTLDNFADKYDEAAYSIINDMVERGRIDSNEAETLFIGNPFTSADTQYEYLGDDESKDTQIRRVIRYAIADINPSLSSSGDRFFAVYLSSVNG